MHMQVSYCAEGCVSVCVEFCDEGCVNVLMIWTSCVKAAKENEPVEHIVLCSLFRKREPKEQIVLCEFCLQKLVSSGLFLQPTQRARARERERNPAT